MKTNERTNEKKKGQSVQKNITKRGQQEQSYVENITENDISYVEDTIKECNLILTQNTITMKNQAEKMKQCETAYKKMSENTLSLYESSLKLQANVEKEITQCQTIIKTQAEQCDLVVCRQNNVEEKLKQFQIIVETQTENLEQYQSTIKKQAEKIEQCELAIKKQNDIEELLKQCQLLIKTQAEKLEQCELTIKKQNNNDKHTQNYQISTETQDKETNNKTKNQLIHHNQKKSLIPKTKENMKECEDDNLDDLLTCENRGDVYINNIKLMLTYKCNLDENKYKIWMKNLSAGKNLIVTNFLFSFADECTHVYVMWNKTFQSHNKKIMEYNGVIPLIRYITGTVQLQRVKNFMTRVNIKKDT
jgi:hypothetical protein